VALERAFRGGFSFLRISESALGIFRESAIAIVTLKALQMFWSGSENNFFEPPCESTWIVELVWPVLRTMEGQK